MNWYKHAQWMEDPAEMDDFEVAHRDAQFEAQYEEMLHAAYQEGWDAAEGGATKEDNPFMHSEPERGREWNTGFDAAMQQIQKDRQQHLQRWDRNPR